MDDFALDAQGAWHRELTLTESTCWTHYHTRNVHWIGVGARIWASQVLSSRAPGYSLPEELMRCAKHEIELRGEFTKRTFGELAAREHEVPASVVLVDCTRRATELLRDGCRDIETDIVRTARFVPGVDVGAMHGTLSASIRRVTNHLLELRGEASQYL